MILKQKKFDGKIFQKETSYIYRSDADNEAERLVYIEEGGNKICI